MTILEDIQKLNELAKREDLTPQEQEAIFQLRAYLESTPEAMAERHERFEALVKSGKLFGGGAHGYIPPPIKSWCGKARGVSRQSAKPPMDFFKKKRLAKISKNSRKRNRSK